MAEGRGAVTEPVDSVKLRQAAETAARAHNVPDYIFEIMHSAADEIDELRKQRTAGYLMHVERTLEDERLAHELD